MNVFDVVTDAEGNWIYDYNRLEANLKSYQQQRPGFFTPFRSSQDFGWTLALPLTAPFTLNLLAGLFSVIASASALAFSSGLFFGACTTLCCQQDTSKKLFTYAMVGLAVSVASTVLASLCVTASLVAICAAIVQLATRSAATLVLNNRNKVQNEDLALGANSQWNLPSISFS